MLLSLIVSVLITGRAQANGSSVLNLPLASQIAKLEVGTLMIDMFLKRLPKCARLTSESPLREFVTTDFYEKCLRPGTRVATSSNFHRSPSGAEASIGRALADLSLAFGMTEAEIHDFEQGRPSVLFTRLSRLRINDGEGRRISSVWFKGKGLYLIKDFVRSYDEEMSLPAPVRFLRKGVPDGITVTHVKAAIDRLLGEVEAPATRMNPDSPDVFRRWLRKTRVDQADDLSIQLACEILLKHLDNSGA